MQLHDTALLNATVHIETLGEVVFKNGTVSTWEFSEYIESLIKV